MIEFLHISKSYNGKEILHDVSLSIEERKTTCIIGASGCGKTTLLRCIAGLDKDYKHTAVGQHPSIKIGMVFQHFNLFENMTVMQNLTFAPIHVLNMQKEDAESLAMEYLKMVGMSERAAYYPSQLSTGQQQRVAIARCLMMKPELLLLDEPMSSLDPISRSEVMDVLRKIRKEMTMIMVSHDLDVVAELADRVVFMNNGSICEDGKPEQVLSSPISDETRQFISLQRNLFYTINSQNFDRPELNALIEHYCSRFGLGRQAHRFVQLAVEESLNIIPLNNKVELVLSKKNDEVRMSLDLSFDDNGCECLNERNVTEENILSLEIIRGLCDVIEEKVVDVNQTTGNRQQMKKQRHIHLEINQERLLLK